MTPTCLGLAMKAIGESGAGGPDCSLLIWLVQACDWDATDGETFTSIETLADRAGVSRSTFIDASKRLVAAGVVVVRHRPGTSSMRRIDWSALESYTSPKSSKGGVRVKREPLTDGRSVTDDRSPSRPMDGHPLTDGRSAPTDGRSQPTPCLPLDLPKIPTPRDAPVPVAGLSEEACEPSEPGKTREKITPAMDQAIGVLAKLNSKAAQRMLDGKSETLVRALRKAIKALTLHGLLARLEYAAANIDGEPMRFWRTTLERKLAPLLTVDGPWVRGLDEAASERVERIEDAGGVDAAADASLAWFDMTQRRAWKGICMPGGAPNLVGDFGNPERWDLAADAAEHDRRMTAFKAAGSIPKWRDADAEGRRQFRERWLELYVKDGAP